MGKGYSSNIFNYVVIRPCCDHSGSTTHTRIPNLKMIFTDGQSTHLQENASEERLRDEHPPTDKNRYSKVQQKRFRKRIHYSERVRTTNEAEPSAMDQAHSRPTINKTLSRQTMKRSVSRVKDIEGGLPTIPESGLPCLQKEIPRQETLSNFR